MGPKLWSLFEYFFIIIALLMPTFANNSRKYKKSKLKYQNISEKTSQISKQHEFVVFKKI